MMTLSALSFLTVLFCCGLCAAIKVPVAWEDSDEVSSSVERDSTESLFGGSDRDAVEPETPTKAPLAGWSSQQQEVRDEREGDGRGKETFREWSPEQYNFRGEKFKAAEEVRSTPVHHEEKKIPVEYFQYPSKKPQFAVDVATFHGVPAPHHQFHSYPVRPHTGLPAPHLGQHIIKKQKQPIFSPFQSFMNTHEGLSRYLGPITSNYEVFHPYKAVEPELKSIYRDPHLPKVKHDVDENKKRLQNYENQAGKSNIRKPDYQKSPEQIDAEHFEESYKPTSFEVYTPEKRAKYYSPPKKQYLPHNDLNRKLKYPLKQNHIKVKPIHYQPLRNQLKKLRQQQQQVYGDENDEYPQAKPRHPQHFAEPPEGYDIYENGKKIFDDYRQDVDSMLNQHSNDYETQNADDEPSDVIKKQKYENEPNSEEEFIPIKMYAQVRKTESTRHLPKEAAFEDAETPDEIINAPRLREAVKSTKAHTIYSEEGYEDKAYDHEGQQKHASNHEGHGGFLKENEKSGGKYKIPFVVHAFEEGDGVAAGNSFSQKKKYENEDENTEEENESETSSAIEEENGENDYDLDDAGSERKLLANHKDNFHNPKALLSLTKESERTIVVDENNGMSIKTQTEHMTATNKKNKGSPIQTPINQPIENVYATKGLLTPSTYRKSQYKSENMRKKRNADFEIPSFSLKNTFLTESDILDLAKQKTRPNDIKIINIKYPYYFEKDLNKNSPLRYAENLRYIPRKTKGGTEFYDSTSTIECPDVEPEVDPVPEALNARQNNEDDDAKDDFNNSEKENKKNVVRKTRQADFENLNKSPRLKGLGDKIDCFKAKYFGENPLDSPFFVEDLISDPEPLTQPDSEVFKIISTNKHPQAAPSDIKEGIYKVKTLHVTDGNKKNSDPKQISVNTQIIGQDGLINENPVGSQSHVYSDIIQNIGNILQLESDGRNEKIASLLMSRIDKDKQNNNVKKFDAYLNREEITIRPLSLRRKRSSQFVYEPYKVIKENQDHDSKKTITSTKVSPLIKQLQASKLVDLVIRSKDEEHKQQRKLQPVKRNVKERNYKNIHREDRAKPNGQEEKTEDFIDVSVDRRRGEPRYELNKSNHKTMYTPITNARSMTLKEYKSRSNLKDTETSEIDTGNDGAKSNEDVSTVSTPKIKRPRPYFDVSAYIPKIDQLNKQERPIALESVNQPIKNRPVNYFPRNNSEHHENVSNTLTTSVSPNVRTQSTTPTNDDSDRAYEYVDYEDGREETTTTKRPTHVRRKIKIRTTTTPVPNKSDDYDYSEDEETTTTTSKPRIIFLRKLLKPVSDSDYKSNASAKIGDDKPVNVRKYDHKNKSQTNPKILEKSLKSEKSTLVTDSKTYGNDEKQDSQKEQIDAMIGGQDNLEEFIGDYDEPLLDERASEVEDLEQNDQEDSESDEENDSKIDDEEDDTDNRRQFEREYEDDRNSNKNDEIEGQRSDIVQSKDDRDVPVVIRRPQIHKDLPEVKPSSGRSSQYQESIGKEDTIRKKPENTKPLNMYRDKNLAKDVNKLAEKNEKFDRQQSHSDVEVFKEDLKLMEGPRHGGNYRSAKIIEDFDEQEDEAPPRPLHGGNLRASSQVNHDEDGGRNGGRGTFVRRQSAALLNTLAQAVPVLTTTPKFILDPSKRMYYYVDS